MKICVTGGCGFIGSALVKRLIRAEHEVTVLDTYFTGHPGNLGDALQECAVIQGSVTNWDAVRRAMSGCHMVYHLAARMDVSHKPRHAAAIMQTNVMGTVWVLTMARSMGVQRVIFASSAAVYGNAYPCVEDGPYCPISIYGASKSMAEDACRVFNALGLDTVVLRIFNVYGNGGHGVVNVFQDGGNTIYGDGQQTRDFIHISDVVNALVGAQEWDSAIYNIGTGIETSILNLWAMIRGNAPPVFQPRVTNHINKSVADLGRVRRLWKARRKLEKCV